MNPGTFPVIIGIELSSNGKMPARAGTVKIGYPPDHAPKVPINADIIKTGS